MRTDKSYSQKNYIYNESLKLVDSFKKIKSTLKDQLETLGYNKLNEIA